MRDEPLPNINQKKRLKDNFIAKIHAIKCSSHTLLNNAPPRNNIAVVQNKMAPTNLERQYEIPPGIFELVLSRKRVNRLCRLEVNEFGRLMRGSFVLVKINESEGFVNDKSLKHFILPITCVTIDLPPEQQPRGCGNITAHYQSKIMLHFDARFQSTHWTKSRIPLSELAHESQLSNDFIVKCLLFLLDKGITLPDKEFVARKTGQLKGALGKAKFLSKQPMPPRVPINQQPMNGMETDWYHIQNELRKQGVHIQMNSSSSIEFNIF